MGYSSLEDFLVAFWEGFFLPKDANNLLTMLWSWQNGDISANPVFKGDFKKALGAIKAKAIVMPGAMDLYFPVADNAGRGGADAECRMPTDPGGLGTFRRWRSQPGGHEVHRRRAEGTARKLNPPPACGASQSEGSMNMASGNEICAWTR